MRYAIVSDLNRCIGCLSCAVACKLENDVQLGSCNIEVARIGPNPKNAGDRFPDVEMYFIPIMCQHCAEPDCVRVCPAEACYKAEDGCVLIDKRKCDGCGLCVAACPYEVGYLHRHENVVQKCNLCQHRVHAGLEPACVVQCGGRALVFGDLDDPDSPAATLIAAAGKDVYSLEDSGNHPTFRYILRNGKWRGHLAG